MNTDEQPGWQKELNALLSDLGVRQEGEPLESQTRLDGPLTNEIHLACLYHKADRRAWQRIHQHLCAIEYPLKASNQHIHWHLYELDEKTMPEEDQIIHDMTQAHILVFLISIDSILLVQRHQRVNQTLQNGLVRLQRGLPADLQREMIPLPYILGVVVKDVQWDEKARFLVRFPEYGTTFAKSTDKDRICVNISERIIRWCQTIANFPHTRE